MPHLFIGNEAHQWKDTSLYGAISTGMVGRAQPLKLIISTAGDTIEGPCHSKQMDVQAMLDEDMANDRMFGVIHTTDANLNWTSRMQSYSPTPTWCVRLRGVPDRGPR